MKKQLLGSIAVLLALASTATAQYGRGGYGHRLSGTTFTEETKAYWAPHRDKLKSYNDSLPRGIREYPIKVHILRASDGTGAISVEEIKAAMSNLNAHFLRANIRFIPLDDYNYINNDTYLKYAKDMENELATTHDVPGVINLYVVKSIKTEKGTINAYTYPPSGTPLDRIFISQKALVNKVSLVREMGHYFALYPTHGPDEDQRSEEYVNGSNCATAGDEICDTPADPRLTPDMIDERCDFMGLHKDGNAKFYRPLTNNFMCDNNRMSCVNSFTRQQYARIMYAAENFRTYLSFPKLPFTKKQIKDLEDRYGIAAQVTFRVDGQPLPTKLEQNLYVAMRPASGGSQLQLDIANERKCYLYVLEGDTSRNVELIYPKNSDKQSFNDEKSQISVPGTGVWSVDKKSGANYVLVLFSKKQLPMEDLLKSMNSEEDRKLTPIQRLYKLYGEHIAALHDVSYPSNSPGVTGIAAERYIVPVFIQYNH